MSATIVNLTPDLARYHLDALARIDATIVGERWEAQHFFSDLPAKWECSALALDNGALIGFVIGSEKQDRIHIHRIAIDPLYQGQAIGTQLLNFVARVAQDRGVQYISLKVAQTNTAAIAFYRHRGFVEDQISGANMSFIIPVQVLIRTTQRT